MKSTSTENLPITGAIAPVILFATRLTVEPNMVDGDCRQCYNLIVNLNIKMVYGGAFNDN